MKPRQSSLFPDPPRAPPQRPRPGAWEPFDFEAAADATDWTAREVPEWLKRRDGDGAGDAGLSSERGIGG